MIEEKAYWLAWSQIPGVGPTLLKRIQQHFENLSQAWTVSTKELEQIEGFGSKLIGTIQEKRVQINPEELLITHLKDNPHFWTPDDVEYPRLLLEIPSPPPILYYRGTVNLEENLGVVPAISASSRRCAIAIVGTRYPTEYGKRWTRRISKTLTEQGFIIVSGMAAGVDTEAHWACLNAQGRTIAVLGTGVNTVYPSSNQKLYQHIEQQGLILSEYPANTKPDRGNFPARNRIIAGLCRAVLIMEAPQRSGALITANFANDFCRDVYVLPGSLDSQQSLGCLSLLNRGAHIILGEEELLEMLGTIPTLDLPSISSKSYQDSKHQQQNRDLSSLEPELAQIIQIIATETLSLDTIAEKTGLDTGTLLASLSQLELMGLVSQLPGMRYHLC